MDLKECKFGAEKPCEGGDYSSLWVTRVFIFVKLCDASANDGEPTLK